MRAMKIDYKNWRRVAITAITATTLLSLNGQALADSGLYLGGSIGAATVSADIEDDFTFDENDFAWKAYGGYNFDLAVVDLGIEGGYVDMGGPSTTFLGESVGLELTGWDIFGLAGVQLGPIGVFAKAGYYKWNVDFLVAGTQVDDDDGNDLAYGIGAKFSFGSLQLRGEYEYFDIEDSNDVYMLSLGLVWMF